MIYIKPYFYWRYFCFYWFIFLEQKWEDKIKGKIIGSYIRLWEGGSVSRKSVDHKYDNRKVGNKENE